MARRGRPGCRAVTHGGLARQTGSTHSSRIRNGIRSSCLEVAERWMHQERQHHHPHLHCQLHRKSRRRLRDSHHPNGVHRQRLPTFSCSCGAAPLSWRRCRSAAERSCSLVDFRSARLCSSTLPLPDSMQWYFNTAAAPSTCSISVPRTAHSLMDAAYRRASQPIGLRVGPWSLAPRADAMSYAH